MIRSKGIFVDCMRSGISICSSSSTISWPGHFPFFFAATLIKSVIVVAPKKKVNIINLKLWPPARLWEQFSEAGV